MATKPKAAGKKRAKNGLGDLHETVTEVRDELEAERTAAPVPRYTSDGILLNPEDFNVASDGTLSPKVG